MGCCLSSDRPPPRAEDQLLELAPARNPGSRRPLPDLDKTMLLDALRHMAKYLADHGAHITVIAVGGAVNTVYLGTRDTTHDLDFYNQNLKSTDYQMISRALQYTSKRMPVLEPEWFNNRTILFIPREQRSALTADAVSQNEVIFRAGGLTVLAAPWKYAFCAKLDRLTDDGRNDPRPYDLPDAVAYLHKFLVRNRVSCVRRSTVEQWAQGYRTRVSQPVLSRVNARFRQRFSRDGINMTS